MDLSEPLRSLAPGLDSAVLEVLARSESALSASQIARLAKRGSRPGQSPIIDRLVQHGLVIAEPSARGHLYRLNREHLLAPSIEHMCRVRHELVRRVSAHLDALPAEILHASIFGSFARGEAGPESDIDVLVVTRDDEPDDALDDAIDVLRDQVRLWTGNPLQVIVLPLADLRRIAASQAPIFQSWCDESLILIGAHLEQLLEETAP